MIHIARDGSQLGTFSPEQINAMLTAGQLRATDPAWWPGAPGWSTLAEAPGVILPSGSHRPPGAAAPVSSALPQEPAYSTLFPHHRIPAPPARPPIIPHSSVSALSASFYAPPAGVLTPDSGGQVPPGAVQALRVTRPWVLLVGILWAIGSGLMLLAAAASLMVGSFRPPAATSGAPAPKVMTGLTAGYIIVALLYIYPVIKLFKYSAAIRRLVRSGSAADLENALRQQKDFWKFVGIILLAGLVLYGVAIGALVYVQPPIPGIRTP